MKKLGVINMGMAISTSALILIVCAVVPLFADQDKGDRNTKRPKQEQQAIHQQDQRNLQEQQSKNLQDQNRGQKQQARNPQEQQREQEQQRHQNEMKIVWQDHRAQNWKTEHRTWKQRGGYNGYRIPSVHYRTYFGRNHGFRINSLVFQLSGHDTRFQYNNYWFSPVDPWPEYWPDNWYENDDVYIDYYGGGYYLYNRSHPRDRVAITFFLGN